jgi:hypothetical protein
MAVFSVCEKANGGTADRLAIGGNMQIKELAQVQMGYSFRSRLEIFADGDTAVIQMKDLTDDNTVDCSSLALVDMGKLKKHLLVQKGDLIFRSRSFTLNTAILQQQVGQAVVSAPLFRIRIIKPELILPEYLNWYISQRDAQVFLTSRAGGTKQKMIGKQDIEELEIPLPGLEKQKIIVETALLAAREQAILKALAEKRAQYISAKLMQFIAGADHRSARKV